MIVKKYNKKNGEDGYRIDLKPTTMSIRDKFVVTGLVEAPNKNTIPAGKSKRTGKEYDAFDVYSFFGRVDEPVTVEDVNGNKEELSGIAVSINIPKGTASAMEEFGSLKNRQVTFMKDEKEMTIDGETKYRPYLAFVVDGKRTAETEKPPIPQEVKDAAQKKVENNEKDLDDVLKVNGFEYTYREAME